MLYDILKFPARLAFPFYIKKLKLNNDQYLNAKGPLLLACNHPNSFLDSIIISTIFKQPVHSLARGDAFGKRWANKLLRSLNMLPVYRDREGAHLLDKNYKTFEQCLDVFRSGGIVLIYSEALCENEWHLRPLKKGTARLAGMAWNDGIPLNILPAGINYSNFLHFGKTVHINFGKPFGKDDLSDAPSDGMRNKMFNDKLQSELKNLVYEIPDKDEPLLKRTFGSSENNFTGYLLAVPALAGLILNGPLYLTVKFFMKKLRGSGHYDSIMLGIMFFSYPLYIFLLTVAAYFSTKSIYAWALPAVMLLSARCLLMYRNTIYAKN